MQTLNNCGCCEGLSVETPVEVYNRPGLKAITYSVGNHTQFRESLLARLSTSGLQALRTLTTRDNDDFTIALLDALATVADVLTFYQERIANESYLGTATEQVSLIELARLIGYELRPGVAAGAYLAFTLDENAGAPGKLMLTGAQRSKSEPFIRIDTGTKVQSVPGPDEQPQTFETIEPIEARPKWNAIKPRLTQPQLIIADNTIVVVKGIDNDLKAGDIVLVSTGPKLKKILKAVTQDEAKTTWLYFDPEPILPAFTEPDFNLQEFKPTGKINSFPEKVNLGKTMKDGNTVVENIINNVWTEEDLSALVQTQGWSETDLKESISKKLADQSLSKDVLYVFRKRASVFGYNALKQMAYNGSNVPLPQSQWTEWELKEAPGTIYLDTTYEQILPESFIAIQQSTKSFEESNKNIYKVEGVEHRSRTDYGISAKTTVISIESKEPWWEMDSTLCSQVNPCLAFIRGITVHAQSTPLTLAEFPIDTEVSNDTIMLDRLYLGLKKGKTIILSGDRADLPGTSSSELRVLAEVFIVKGITVLKLDKELTYSYIRSSVSINANIVEASHGETVKETLGGGDATKQFQKFILKQPPLTFISAATPSGTQSTLQIRVNDILWQEVPSLYGHGPGEHIYITRLDDEGKTTVIFGDGKNGARLPTGQENIKATYRKGIGAAGLLKPDQLSQLVTRPLGVKEVTNPLRTSGAEDRESSEDARRNATLTIFTLGRIVSLQDYEDFARSFAGIAKALATWTWTGQKRSVHVTVAGVNVALVDPAEKLYQNLLTTVSEAGIPEVPVSIVSYQPVFFRIVANIKVHPDYIPDKVITSVEQSLREKFSFTERAFGQSVNLSEVITVMQNVKGVIAVDVDQLYRSDASPSINDRITAKVPQPSREKPFPAELLTIDQGPIDLKLMV